MIETLFQNTASSLFGCSSRKETQQMRKKHQASRKPAKLFFCVRVNPLIKCKREMQLGKQSRIHGRAARSCVGGCFRTTGRRLFRRHHGRRSAAEEAVISARVRASQSCAAQHGSADCAVTSQQFALNDHREIIVGRKQGSRDRCVAVDPTERKQELKGKQLSQRTTFLKHVVTLNMMSTFSV